MTIRSKQKLLWSLLAFAAGGGPCEANAQDIARALYNGPYAAILGQFDRTDGDNELGDGSGVTLAGGIRRGAVGFEARGSYTFHGHGTALGASVDGLVFPIDKLSGLYAIGGIGLTNVDGYPGVGDKTFNNTTLSGGMGYLLPLHYSRYEFGLRVEALYQYGKRNKRSQDQVPPTVDLPVESSFRDVILQVGLQFPFGAPLPTEPEPAVPAQVVPVDQPPAVAPEPMPPSLPPPPCEVPAAGQPVSLAGCRTGDSFVLRGVTFEFDKARLTPDAKIILDGIADALLTQPGLSVELDGHTDDHGAAAYNQKLSETRARSVLDYLVLRGVDGGHLQSRGFGKSMPVADNATDEGRALNRRVEFKILSGPDAMQAQPAALGAAATALPIESSDAGAEGGN
ncbi:MAG: hypothetical protein JWQ90_814 [Hydrocarboniphaga sp.]|uniref:OmpA family protein n=1 Tax=Hydrocarboniphaga sp. TaxID=2033016 RepID=UPI00263163B8|nr:OmpA family protein [Hydrocarboniphaga sp.]MDB5968364.1 hypothetical protein [Hydrocarboniphaga sp.]